MSSVPSHEMNHQTSQTDICLIVEGCYPYIPGGVSSWIDWLMRTQPHLTFSVVAILADKKDRELRYEFPPNLKEFHELFLHEQGTFNKFKKRSGNLSDALVEPLIALFEGGGINELAQINKLINDPDHPISLDELMNSPLAWSVLQEMYERTMPHASFHHYFWAWRALLGGLFAAIKFPLPRANAYHTISTGYAGLLAARAQLETGRPAILTEHGIYTNERQIEILMADWIADMVDQGLSIDDKRYDLRDFWINAFKSYARTCYQACNEIITLYSDNQRLQKALGAPAGKLAVIANGIDDTRFKSLNKANEDDPPTIALIGRVVPIKDIMTFISGAHLARKRLPGLQVLIMGPDDEDEAYATECRALVSELSMNDCVEFTGSVNITDYMPRIHIMVLTSLSEAQPLVILEAGAAQIPCIATDVGSCREIIEGRDDEIPRLGHGGIVTELVNAQQMANAVCELLGDEQKRRSYGENLSRRVEQYYLSHMASDAYKVLYQRYSQIQAVKD